MPEADVLVVGFGPAGAAAANAAHDPRARGGVVEKRGVGGGDAGVSGGFLFEPPHERAVDHLDSLFFGKTPRVVAAEFAEGLLCLKDWIAQLGSGWIPFAPPGALGDFPHLVPSWPNAIDGREATYYW